MKCPLLAIAFSQEGDIKMSNLIKKQEFKAKLKDMFLSEKVKQSDIGPTRSDVFDLLSTYSADLWDYEQVEVRERMLFLVQYLMHCRHSGRPIDWILVERLIDGCLQN